MDLIVLKDRVRYKSFVKLKKKCDIIADFYEILSIALETNNNYESLNKYILYDAASPKWKDEMKDLIQHKQPWLHNIHDIFNYILTKINYE